MICCQGLLDVGRPEAKWREGGGYGAKFLLNSVCFYLTYLSVFVECVHVRVCMRDLVALCLIYHENTMINYFRELVICQKRFCFTSGYKF